MTFEEVLFKYKNTYYSFPQSLKTFLGSLYGKVPLSVRFGEKFTFHTNIINKFEKSNEQYKLDFMYNKTLETLIFAENNIPYYKKLFLQMNISSKDYKSLNDIKIFPSLTKSDIKKNINNLYSNKIEKPTAYYSGGSLSTPTKYFLPISSRAKEKAYNNYIFSKIGYKYRDKTVLIKGREISNLEKEIFWDYEPIDNYLALSNNYLYSNIFPSLYEKANDFHPKFMFGYPSAIISFIRQSKKYGYKPFNLEGIILASETIYFDELKLIQDFFKVNVLTHYGHTERNVIGYRINNGVYNFLNSYGLVRKVDEEIVTTTFDNFVMPFINYKTADYVTGDTQYYRESDIMKTVKNIEGRTQDYLVTKDKRLVSITTMCGGQYLPLDKMNAIQYIQKEYGKVIVLVESNEDLSIAEIEKGMLKLVSRGIIFEIQKVNKIEKTSRGKRVMCKQYLNIDEIKQTLK